MKKKIVYQNVGKNKCNSCGNDHVQWWMISHKRQTKDKIGCASYMNYDIHNKYYAINCSYGSEYDNLTFKVVERLVILSKHLHAIDRLIKVSQLGANSVICDKCIQRFIRRRYIIEV